MVQYNMLVHQAFNRMIDKINTKYHIEQETVSVKDSLQMIIRQSIICNKLKTYNNTDIAK